MVEIVQHISEIEWRRFLDVCSEATIYHTPEWKMFLEKTFSYKPHYLYATDESGQLTGMLPLFQVKSRLTGNRLCSVPFSHECGHLGDDAAFAALIDEAVALKDIYHIEKIEIRNAVKSPMFHEKNTFCTHVLELSENSKDTWKKLDKGSARWAIKKAERIGVSVVSSINTADIRDFYELNCVTKQNLGVPCHPWDFFKNLFSTLGSYVQMYLARYEMSIIAGGVMECFKDKVLYGYGAADPNHRNVQPYHALIWKSIEDACAQGYRTYDFGRTSYSDSGLMQFKKKWGTQERELCYSYHPASTKSVITDRDSSIYRLGNSAIRKLPMSVYKMVSKSAFPHFG